MLCKVFLYISAIVFIANADNCDPSKCPKISKVYKELQCKPIIEDGKCCPTHLECPDLKNLDETKCHYEGETFENGKSLSEDKTSSTCTAACFCSATLAPAKFICAHIDCAEFFQPQQPECIRQYKLGGCCSSNRVCVKEAIDKLATCHFEGKSYREGQRMYSEKESCYSCICANNFDNTTIINNPNCKEINCGVQLRNLNSVRDGCIPVYFGNDRCCPIDWRCPKKGDTLIEGEGRSEASSELNHMCNYGDLKMKIGDFIQTNNKCRQCKCNMPPFAECIQTPDCNA